MRGNIMLYRALLFTGLLAVVSFAQSVPAQTITKSSASPLEIAMVQTHFNRLFSGYKIEVDGKWGPATQKAVNKLAVRYQVDGTLGSLIRKLNEQAAENFVHVEANNFQEALRESLSYNFLDPFSSKIRNVYFNGSTICGEINAKNSFGAYTGFKQFRISLAVGDVVIDANLFAYEEIRKIADRENKLSEEVMRESAFQKFTQSEPYRTQNQKKFKLSILEELRFGWVFESEQLHIAEKARRYVNCWFPNGKVDEDNIFNAPNLLQKLFD